MQSSARIYELTSVEKKSFENYINGLIQHLYTEPNPELQKNVMAALRSALDQLKNYRTPDRLSLKNVARFIFGKAQGPLREYLDELWMEYEAKSKALKEEKQPNARGNGSAPPPPPPFPARHRRSSIASPPYPQRVSMWNTFPQVHDTRRFSDFESHEYHRRHYQRKFQDVPQLNIGYDNAGTWNATPYLIKSEGGRLNPDEWATPTASQSSLFRPDGYHHPPPPHHCHKLKPRGPTKIVQNRESGRDWFGHEIARDVGEGSHGPWRPLGAWPV
ncbi:hypothetical protein R3P38DRAFT_3265908 [Favolaschia claudopus]|uniref:Uncharacterized protein n=1 Tax=Favolaschia claudopus TaxID=2862362 RepID=A0AAW0BZM7_9AGAR